MTLKELGECLGGTIPNVIAKTYSPAGSSNVIDAQLMDIEQAMRRAVMRTESSAPRPTAAPAVVANTERVDTGGSSAGCYAATALVALMVATSMLRGRC